MDKASLKRLKAFFLWPNLYSDIPIKKALEGIIKREQDSDYSPILELIQKIKVTVLHKVITENKGIQSSGKKSVKIHLFSDLLQHTSNFSFYRKDNLTQFLKSKKWILQKH